MQNIIEILQSAIDTGNAVTIIYNGGSKPGQARELIPLSLNGENLSAREPTSRRAKTFKIQKIASAALQSGEAAKNPEAIPAPPKSELVPNFGSFEEYAIFLKEKLKGTVFNVSEAENYFSVFEFFKNGKPRKTPSASIQYIDRSTETVFNFETGEFEEQKRELTGRERPWRVDSKRLSEGKTFSQLQSAVELFLKEVAQI